MYLISRLKLGSLMSKAIIIIKLVEHFFKEAAEWLMRATLRSAVRDQRVDLRCLNMKIHQFGYTVIEKYWSDKQCRDAIEKIEQELSNVSDCHRWDDEEGADHRLYHAEKIGGLLEDFLKDPFIEHCRYIYTGVKNPDKLLLAARLDATSGNRGSGGGWHRDSPHRSQFKAILYLNDVDTSNGPFQYLERSHKFSHSLRLVLRSLARPHQYRFTEEEIMRILSTKSPVRTFSGKAGTLLLVDTKGIHRGCPITLGRRYALTQYCYDGKKPANSLP